jgi:hypothetical protein
MRTSHALHLPHLARANSPRPPRWPARLLAHVSAPWIDPQLANGTPAWHSPVLAARAVQLTGKRRRRATARWLESLVERAQQRPAPFRGAAVTPCHEQVRDALPQILAIASQLRSTSPVDARGIAALRRLLSDGGGPCYTRIHPGALTVALEDAAQWLDVSD